MAFDDAIVFLDNIGIYDVVLPFLLVFVIVYALLEKTRVFGTEEVDGKQVSRKNLNSMVAFVIAFLVVASSSLVAIISQFAANVVLLLLISISFLLLVGSFSDPKEMKEGFFLKDKKLRNTFIGIMAFGLVLVFLNAFTTSSRFCYKGTCTWLEVLWGIIVGQTGNSAALSAIILLLIIGGFIAWIGRDAGKSEDKDDEE